MHVSACTCSLLTAAVLRSWSGVLSCWSSSSTTTEVGSSRWPTDTSLNSSISKCLWKCPPIDPFSFFLCQVLPPPLEQASHSHHARSPSRALPHLGEYGKHTLTHTHTHSLSLSLSLSYVFSDFSQEPGSRFSVTVKLPYLEHSITMPDKVQRREVGVACTLHHGCRGKIYTIMIFH